MKGKPLATVQHPTEPDLDLIMAEALLIAKKKKRKAEEYYRKELSKALSHV